jgi:hypothetical protein
MALAPAAALNGLLVLPRRVKDTAMVVMEQQQLLHEETMSHFSDAKQT